MLPDFVQQSVDEVIKTLFEAVVLVVIVIILFLQSWRAAIIPIVAIPVSLVGTFFVMTVFGFMPPLAQSIGRITDPTGTQFGDVGVNHSEQSRARKIPEQICIAHVRLQHVYAFVPAYVAHLKNAGASPGGTVRKPERKLWAPTVAASRPTRPA